jgi:hypothetical protein
MKRAILLSLSLLASLFAAAQDVITRKDGQEIAARILELTPDLVIYKRADNPDGPTVSVYKHEIFMIKYANGVKEILTPQPPQKPAPVAPLPAPQQVKVAAPPQPEEPAPYQMKLNGPRFGVTYITEGKLTRRLAEEFDATSPVISQFGWQFETQIFNIEGGPTGLVEFVPLIGGLDQGAFLPSASLMFGLRGESGMELGFGPNISPAGTGVVLAAGTSFTSGNVHFPVNFAVVPSKDGARFSLMFGFNYRKR